MADRPHPSFPKPLNPSRAEVDDAVRRADFDGLNPLITTPADELDRSDQLAATSPSSPGDMPQGFDSNGDDHLLADEIDHAGLELEDDAMGDFRSRREEPWVSWPSI